MVEQNQQELEREPVDPSEYRTTNPGPRSSGHGAGRNGFTYGSRPVNSSFPQLASDLALFNRNLSYVEIHEKLYQKLLNNNIGPAAKATAMFYYSFPDEEKVSLSYEGAPDLVAPLRGDGISNGLRVDASIVDNADSYYISWPFGPSVTVPDIHEIYNSEPNEDSALSTAFNLFPGEEGPYVDFVAPTLAIAKFVSEDNEPLGTARRMSPHNTSRHAQGRATPGNHQLGKSQASQLIDFETM